MKFKVILTLFACSIGVLSNSSTTFATETNETTIVNSSINFHGYELDQPDNLEIENRLNYLIYDNAPFSTGGLRWTQPSGFRTARVHINNTRPEPLTVSLRRNNSNVITPVTVSGYSSITIPLNNAMRPGGSYRLDFSSANGLVAGTASVRVSDRPLNN